MDKQNEQPKQPKASKPNATQQLFGPAPAPAETPYEKQPVNQQYFAQPQAAPVQYVVMAPSLKGVKGWLAFFMVILAIDALIYVGVFFNSLLNLSVATSVISAIMAPIIVAALSSPCRTPLGRYHYITTNMALYRQRFSDSYVL